MSQSNQPNANQLGEQLVKIEKMAELIRTQRGFTRDCRALKILAELIKEQNPNAHSRSTASSLR